MKIFAYVDQSQFAESVCQHAVWISQQLGVAIELIYAIEPDSLVTSGDFSGYLALDNPQTALEEQIRLDELHNRGRIAQAREYLDATANSLREHGVDAVARRLYQGAIVDHLREHTAECLVAIVGKRGDSSSPSSQRLGSNVERLVRSAHRPVLVVSPEFTPVEYAVIAWDGGASTGKAINLLANRPLLRGAKTTLLHVVGDTSQVSSSLEDATQHLQAAGMEATSKTISGPVVDTILNEVRDSGADLLVMGAYGHSRVRHLVIGSTTTDILMRSDTSVLVFH